MKQCSLLAQRITQLAAGRAQVRLRGSTSREVLQREGRALVERRQRLRGCWGRATRGSQWGLGPRGADRWVSEPGTEARDSGWDACLDRRATPIAYVTGCRARHKGAKNRPASRILFGRPSKAGVEHEERLDHKECACKRKRGRAQLKEAPCSAGK